MSKLSEFYSKVLSEESTKKELSEILGGIPLEEADDLKLGQIGELAGKLGFDITIEEAREYLHSEETELDEDDLDAVAGGKTNYDVTTYVCTVGGQVGYDENNYGDNAKPVSRSFQTKS